MDTSEAQEINLPAAKERGFKVPGFRWVIISLVFFATLINYIDRLTLTLTVSVLAPLITDQLHLTNTEFGGIATWFLFAYTISQGLSGKLYDRVGIKKGFSVSMLSGHWRRWRITLPSGCGV